MTQMTQSHPPRIFDGGAAQTPYDTKRIFNLLGNAQNAQKVNFHFPA